ncbi:hypothetical protein IscW_ISCW010470 [Ixodes scapularis]|uniref:EB domain-containing protein n=1 Tax=Ixodes scapularis TaxID=6945 RepID=B7Q769_IXOSC|nr:hypothetical protein IscW_ISCW010470 [Ixodes scapularis]|eukprot:XP_002403718.1 hypothetical protein IscW_ISCW010470 [Ixodes scapularis]
MGGVLFENIALRHTQKPCLFSETCSAVDAHSRCAKGSCECLQGHEVHHVGACRRWASYDQQCDNKVHCLEEGVECVDGVCMCDRGRLRFNGTCQVVDEGLGSLNVRQKTALGGSVFLTMTGVILALTNLCHGRWSRRERKTLADDEKPMTSAIRSASFPEWADANSCYMSTRYWVSEQPYYSLPQRKHHKMYFKW